MSNFQEVEKRIILKEGQKEQVIANLLSMGAEYKGDEKIRDEYFCDKKCKKFEDTAMKEVGSYGLRIRESEKDGVKKSELNIKVITSEDNHHSWEEHEVEVNSIDEMKCILLALGFKNFYSTVKVRHKYALDSMEFLIEDIEDFNSIIEIEGKTTLQKSDEMQEKIIDYVEKLGLDKKDIVERSVTYILMQKKSRF
jgi:predicted adenylyl cyclase CyaB